MKPDFNSNDLIPCIVQDSFSKNVLMLAYMNEQAYQKTLETGKVTFFSRSRQELWTKGETSGNFLNVVEVRLDCDNDTILVLAHPEGPACHLNNDTCFGDYANDGNNLGFLTDIIDDRAKNPSESSYTNTLLSNIDKAAQKVGEEAVELVIEAKDQREERFLEEAADLMYHYLVLLKAKNQSLSKVTEVLRKRMK